MEESTTEKRSGSVVAVALLHYPVFNKNHRTVATAVTNMDIHDIARVARTYGLARYYVVTPLAEQQELVRRIQHHWQEGWGSSYNPKRKEAIRLMTVAPTLEEARADMAREFGGPVRTVATGATGGAASVSYRDMADIMRKQGGRYLILLGTGWGLTDEVKCAADYVLAPIAGRGDYNHLSVRSATAIIIDRLLGDDLIQSIE